MSYQRTFPISLGENYAGKTLAGQLADSAGVDVGAAITSGFVDFGGGCYSLTASIPDGFSGTIRIYESSSPAATLGISGINPGDGEYLDAKVSSIKAKTDLITTGGFTVAVTTPVLSDGTIELVQGDDYPTGGEVVLTFTNYSGPSLVGASVSLVLQERTAYDAGTGTAADTIAGTLAVDGTTITCTFVLTATQTAALTATTPPAKSYAYRYQCIATTTDGKKRTLGLGAINLKRKAT